MKRFLFILIFFFQFTLVFGMNPADSLNKLDSDFKSQCFQYYTKIDKSEIRNNINAKYKTYKIITDKQNLVFTQLGFILPYKKYFDSKDNYEYSINRKLEFNYLNDNNKKTFFENNTAISGKEIIINLSNELKKGDFNFVFDFDSKYYSPEYFILFDGKEILVSKDNINDFSFSKLIIRFKPIIENKEISENIKIYELSFNKTKNTYLIKSFYNDNIEVYSNYNCKEQKNYKAKEYNFFEINKDTKTINLNLIANPKYNVYKEVDTDNDWVPDTIDNCKARYNPDQLDSDGDGRGDICSDFDKDGLIGYYDNCPMVSNKDQKDININGIGDVCEFDKDEDGVFDSFDNCINIKNKNQEDKDKDGIGDLCDNCKLYNPAQLDRDNSGIGDICEEKDKQLKENDKDKDGIIDFKDNCINTSNFDQSDTDKDGIGDLCDNCKDIQNKNQEDKNKNTIGDLCEDSDGDGYLGYLDNCISIKNEDQKDSDNNGIGDLCEDSDDDKILFFYDNCPYDYNPDQSDIDKDNIGDKCDKKDERYIESNKKIFIGLLVLLVIVFGIGIFLMSKKIAKNK